MKSDTTENATTATPVARHHEFLLYSDSPYCVAIVNGDFCNHLADAAVHQVAKQPMKFDTEDMRAKLLKNTSNRVLRSAKKWSRTES